MINYTGWESYATTFRDGTVLVARGSCAADAAARALRVRDAQRGDRLAVVEKVEAHDHRWRGVSA